MPSYFKPARAESLGLITNYRCTFRCRHCLYCSSPHIQENPDFRKGGDGSPTPSGEILGVFQSSRDRSTVDLYNPYPSRRSGGLSSGQIPGPKTGRRAFPISLRPEFGRTGSRPYRLPGQLSDRFLQWPRISFSRVLPGFFIRGTKIGK
jgi:hypothetical protein